MKIVSEEQSHIPVLVQEVLEQLAPLSIKTFYDGTLGAGGHASKILEAHPEIERYIGCDRDPEALLLAQHRLAPWHKKMIFLHGNFADLDEQLDHIGVKSVDGFFLTSESPLCS